MRLLGTPALKTVGGAKLAVHGRRFVLRSGPAYDRLIHIANTSKAPETEVTMRIVLIEPPAGVDFGLQEGHGRDYATVQKQRSKSKDLKFEFQALFKGAGNAAPDFGGPFVQGPKGERFVYIDIGTYAGQSDTQWSRRLKIPLRDISWKMIDAVSNGTALLEARVPGTGRDGGPNCATVKPFDGWKVVE